MIKVEVHETNGQRLVHELYEAYDVALPRFNDLYLQYGKHCVVSLITERGATIKFP